METCSWLNVDYGARLPRGLDITGRIDANDKGLDMRKAGSAGGHIGAGRVAGRALFGAGVMAFALGVGNALGAWLAELLGLDGFAARLIPAVLVTLLAVPIVIVMWRRQYGTLNGLGLAKPGSAVRGFLVGLGVTGLAAVVAMAAGSALSWIEWGAIDVATLAIFLATNTVIALLLEAIPEEMTLRGYVWGNLRKRYRPALSAFFVTFLFLLVPGVSTVVSALTRVVLGEPAGHIGLVPEGEDAIIYLALLTLFSIMLITARVALGTVWTGIGAHLMFLTVNRLLVEGEERDTGWSIELVSLDALLLIPMYVMLAVVFYVLLRGANRIRLRRARPVDDATG